MVRPESLILPIGVRLARADDLPRDSQRELAAIAAAHLTTGYIRRDSSAKGYRAFFEANVHAPQLWHAFRRLATALLPHVAAPIIGIKDDDPLLGPYTDRDAALEVLEPHAHHLQHDGYLEFGMIFQYKGITEEVFVPSAKYLQIWTNRSDDVETIFRELGLPPVPNLQFVDEFPRVSQSLATLEGTAGWFGVLEAVREAFSHLVPAEHEAFDV